jgi:hypothetical protein
MNYFVRFYRNMLCALANGTLSIRRSLSPFEAFMTVFTFTSCMAGLGVDSMRRWQSNLAIGGLDVAWQFPVRSIYSLAVVLLWSYGLMRYFNAIGWLRWLALPYVLLFLCPLAWLFAHRVEAGGDFVAIFLLQVPVIVAYVRHTRRVANCPPLARQ